MRDFKDFVPSRHQKIETMADMPKEKRCRDCKIMKPNTFEFFGKKWHKTRTNYVTVDVCSQCKRAKISNAMRVKWADKRDEMNHANRELEQLVKGKQVVEVPKTVEMAPATEDPATASKDPDPFDWG